MTQHTTDSWAANDFSHPHSALGAMAWLMQHADYHRPWNMHSVNVDIAPAIELGQYRVYHTSEHEPIGFVTWAYVSEEVKDILIHRRRPMLHADWRSGDLLMFNDCVAPFGHVRAIVSDMRQHFSNEYAQAFSLRRGQLGEIRKINRWLAPHSDTNVQLSENNASTAPPLARNLAQDPCHELNSLGKGFH